MKNSKFKQIKEKITEIMSNNLNIKFILYILILIVSLVLTSIFLVKALNFEEKVLNYKENGFLDYRVYLKDNDFYPNDYLDKDMIYVSSLIDYIDVDFNYNFKIDENIDANFTYDIVGKLMILDEKGSKVYFTKEYDLSENTTNEILNQNEFNIAKNIEIDYDYYNDIANKFKMDFGVETISYLRVYLTVKKTSKSELIKLDNVDSQIYLDIPLSQKSINMTIDYSNLNQSRSFIKEQTTPLDNILYIVLTASFILLSIVILSKILYLIPVLFPSKKNAYDKYVNKILKEYDRLIAETNHCPNFSEYKLINIPEFKELVDVRDNLKKPIMHYILKKHEESYFYILDDVNLYLVKITNKQLEREKNGKNI